MTVNNNYKITHSLYFLTTANCETADSQPATTRSFFDGLFWGLSRAIRPTHAGGTLVKNGHLCQAKFLGVPGRAGDRRAAWKQEFFDHVCPVMHGGRR